MYLMQIIKKTILWRVLREIKWRYFGRYIRLKEYRNVYFTGCKHKQNKLIYELETLESFLKEQPIHIVWELSDYILKRVAVNLKKIRNNKPETSFATRFVAVSEMVENILKIYKGDRWGGGFSLLSINYQNSFFVKNSERVNAVANMLEDESSKKIYLGIIKFRQTLNEKDFPILRNVEKEYFIEEVKFKKNEVFIDCGAYDGDTIDEFLKHCPNYKQIVAFEPDIKNFEKCKGKYGNNPQITLINTGVYSEDKLIRFVVSGATNGKLVTSTITMGSKEGGEIIELQVKRIDNLGLQNVTFIKMDIEGSELDALKGAEETILRDRPKLAISIYHSEEDMIGIAEYVHDLIPEYKLYIRHHRIFPKIHETILYAIMP